MASRFRVAQICCGTHDEEDRHKDDIVFPADGPQGDRVDERIEKDRRDCCDPSNSETPGAESIWPDLAGICYEERCPV